MTHVLSRSDAHQRYTVHCVDEFRGRGGIENVLSRSLGDFCDEFMLVLNSCGLLFVHLRVDAGGSCQQQILFQKPVSKCNFCKLYVVGCL